LGAAPFPDDVDEAVEDNRRPADELASLYPFVELRGGPR